MRPASANHASSDYCPVHGIKAMLTDEGIAQYAEDLVAAKRAVNAHLARTTPAKAVKLQALGAAARAKADASAKMDAKRLAYLNLVATEIDGALARMNARQSRK